MFDDCYLTLKEKFILFTFQFHSKEKCKVKRSTAYDNLFFKFKFLEEVRSNAKPPIIRLSGRGRNYILYRREKRLDRLILPVTVSVVASLTSTVLLNFLIQYL